ncbi:hypothetical protein LTR97_007400 [Elasticomyces elasticus]|uniref:Uncharacterized protein n=1 Tax=Elasticomyces elasticus TaxID=574655 RepID=A0AAN7W8A3_9PEZI|nr:hypothetical protein LTR97_007400 [Elasticomyces elasticus]
MPSLSINAILAITLEPRPPAPYRQPAKNIFFLRDNALAAGRQELVDLGPFQSIEFFEGDEAQPGGFIACQEGFDCFTDGQNAPIAQDMFECSVLTGDQFDKIGVVPDGDA